MGYEASVLYRATRRLEAGRRQREEALTRRKAEIYAQLPRLREIDKELKGTVYQIIASSLREGRDPAPSIQVIKDHNLSLQAERTHLLLQNGWGADALDEQPACPKCNDTGWVGAQMCTCLKKLCGEEQIKELSKLLDLGEQSFETFSMDYYSPLPWPGEALSPRENMEFIFDLCSNYARKFGRFKLRNLFLSGAPGLGKTFLSACIARTVSENGFSVVYDTAVNVFARFEEQKFARDRLDAEEAKDETKRYLGCDLLILDDLGSELTTPFVQSALYTLINARLMANKQTVISSNLTMTQVRQRYTPQISSRLEGEYRVLPFYGEDIRLQRKQQL
ncbi:ATP-binding protein [Flavonifractor sp. AGMB03687]|uniref:ATP-binding protein n=1 Tax=Flavonifractor sp. AGMB03687 TaxID=2785133 RepID=UPI001ADECE5D|nr:ATP-binding protein [Flavonifractor sp. AGMB03687]